MSAFMAGKSHPEIHGRKSCNPLAVLLVVGLIIGGCDTFPNAPRDNLVLEGPVDGLTGTQLALFVAGDEEFGRTFAPFEGAGPLFIAQACVSCHPGDGKGHPAFDLTRFGRMTADGFDPMRSFGGPQLQHRAVPGYTPEVVPLEATGVARFSPPLVTGLGFLEAVDESTLFDLADPGDADGDGISGRVQLVDSTDLIADIVSFGAILAGDQGTPPRSYGGRYVGRFGRKARSVNLLEQTVSAYAEDIGLTSDLVPTDPVNVQVGPRAADAVPDPEISSATVDNVVFYLRTLRPPPRRGADDPNVLAGETLFEQVGCASCHVPALRTGYSSIGPLNDVVFYPYTDLLLHDMGPELDDGYTEGSASTAEWRTTPLWGLGLAERSQGGKAFYLHDGRAGTLDEAIGYHGGEGAASREAFGRLTTDERDQLIRFLRSL